jgi:hypothetical protein
MRKIIFHDALASSALRNHMSGAERMEALFDFNGEVCGIFVERKASTKLIQTIGIALRGQCS